MLFLCILIALYSIASCEEQTCPSGAAAQCVLTPEEMEGPYYVNYNLVRKDVREGKPGLRVDLRLIINDVNTCKPLPNVSVDIWHCDEFGFYSGFLKNDPNKPAPAGDHFEHSDNSTFNRGVQFTDENGVVDFVTNFPGWYYGRTVHIHVEVFKAGHKAIFTGQLYFTEQLTAKVAKVNPYAKHTFRRYRNEEDGIFTEEHGNQTILMPKQIDEHNFESGLKAEMTLSINPKKY